ncbi:hypothetical protein SDC9_208817 [bioreactor metagenome]|uniref:Uncharacterized protein n=1 Tax=bioreactor metagenome TaxID=1076179 RepID=A0A645JNA4_9ZZZZ
MRRVDGVDLEHDVADLRQRRVGAKRGDHLLGRAHMHVIGFNELLQRRLRIDARCPLRGRG